MSANQNSSTARTPHHALMKAIEHHDPHATMRWMIHAYAYSQLVYAMADLGIADLLADAPLDSATIANHVAMPEERLLRFLQGLAWCGTLKTIEAEDGEHAWELTPLGRTLLSNAEGTLADDVLQAGDHYYAAWGHLTTGLRTGDLPFELAHGRAFFEEIDANQAARERFDRVMNRVATLNANALIEIIDLSTARRIVDIGGGNGETLARLLTRWPQAQGVVFDRARSEVAARENLARHGCQERSEFVIGDFFESVESDGDVYILQRILHDWEDDECVRILRHVAQALAPGGRVLVVEELLGTEPPGPGDHAIAIDLAMLAITGGRERSLKQYQALINKAGLQLVQSHPTSHGMWILELSR